MVKVGHTNFSELYKKSKNLNLQKNMCIPNNGIFVSLQLFIPDSQKKICQFKTSFVNSRKKFKQNFVLIGKTIIRKITIFIKNANFF